MPQGITQQDLHRQMFTSHERTANIEHLQHMDRLAEVRLTQRGIVGHRDVDFRTPAPVANPSISVAMANKLKASYESEEARITKENQYLMQRLLVHASDEQRIKHHVALMPQPQPKPFAEQGSNIVSRRRQAERMAEANEVLMYAMATVKPSVSNREIAASVKVHNQRVKQISKFRPAAEYAGARELRGDMKMILAEGAIADGSTKKSMSARSGTSSSPRKQEWQHLSPHDVRRHRMITDRCVRSVFTRDEDEVLSEAANAPRQSDVTVQRLTWSEIGKQVANSPVKSLRPSTMHSTASSNAMRQQQNSPRQGGGGTAGSMGSTFGSSMVVQLPPLPPATTTSDPSMEQPSNKGEQQGRQDGNSERPSSTTAAVPQQQSPPPPPSTTIAPLFSAKKPAAPSLPPPGSSSGGRKKPSEPLSSSARRGSTSKDGSAAAATGGGDKDLKVFQDGDLYVVST